MALLLNNAFTSYTVTEGIDLADYRGSKLPVLAFGKNFEIVELGDTFSTQMYGKNVECELIGRVASNGYPLSFFSDGALYEGVIIAPNRLPLTTFTPTSEQSFIAVRVVLPKTVSEADFLAAYGSFQLVDNGLWFKTEPNGDNYDSVTDRSNEYWHYALTLISAFTAACIYLILRKTKKLKFAALSLAAVGLLGATLSIIISADTHFPYMLSLSFFGTCAGIVIAFPVAFLIVCFAETLLEKRKRKDSGVLDVTEPLAQKTDTIDCSTGENITAEESAECGSAAEIDNSDNAEIIDKN